MLDSTFYLIFIIGVIISVGFIAGKFFQKYKIPRVLAFVLVGIFLGSAGIISPMLLDKLYPLVELALGFIGFAIGNELNIKDLIKGSKKIFNHTARVFIYLPSSNIMLFKNPKIINQIKNNRLKFRSTETTTKVLNIILFCICCSKKCI